MRGLVRPTRRDLVTGGAALAAFGALPARGAPSQEELLLFGSPVPAWVRALTPGVIPQVAADFVNNRYWAAGQGNISFSSLLALTRASPETVTDASGNITYAASGQPALSNLGLGVWGARTNLLLWSQDFTKVASWTKGINTTVTPAYAIALDGTMTAQRVQIGAQSQNATALQQVIALAASQTHTTAFYVRATSGSAKFALKLTQSSVADHFSPDLTVTTSWQRIPLSATFTSGGTGNGVVGLVTDVAGNATDLILWGGQVEANTPFISPYISTVGASAMRLADQYQIIGALKTIFGGASGWLFANVAGSPSNNTPTIWDKDNSNNTPAYFDTTSTITAIMSGVSLTATLGSGSQSGGVKNLVTWDASGRSLAANGGTVASDANTLAGTNTPYLGSGGGLDFFYSGNFKAIAAGNVRLPDALVKSIAT